VQHRVCPQVETWRGLFKTPISVIDAATDPTPLSSIGAAKEERIWEE